jgi:RHS repeat-associated protein
VPCAKIDGGNEYSIVSDYLGTPTHAYNNAGEKVWEREIDCYGKTRKLHGEKDFCPYLYQGQSVDIETGLAYNRFRYYDNEIGGYICKDPIRLEGGKLLYSYVNDTNSWLDPFGLAGTANEGDLGRHGDLKKTTGGGQSHHLNQDAAFKSAIPREDGAAIKLEGNAFSEIGSNHYNAHNSMEGFWNNYRAGGALEGSVPRINDYNRALFESLNTTTLTKGQIRNAMRNARANQVAHGLTKFSDVPRVPGRINQSH